MYFPGRVTNSLVDVVFRAGHWASTHFILRLAGIEGVQDTSPPIIAMFLLVLSPNAKLQFDALSAGAHKAGIASERLKRLLRSPLEGACPSMDDFRAILGILNGIRSNRAGHHVGARYLAGRDRVQYQDSECDNYLGRIGTFIINIYGRSTLARSLPPC